MFDKILKFLVFIMGNIFCKKCDSENFQISKNCAEQFLLDDATSVEDQWKERLKCLDDKHSKNVKITEADFDKLLDEIQKQLHMDIIPNYCKNKDLLIECIRKNPNSLLSCENEINDFIDCVDALRVRRIKQTIQESKKKERADLSALFNP